MTIKFYGYLSFDGDIHNIICHDCVETIKDKRNVFGYYEVPNIAGQCCVCNRAVIDIIENHKLKAA